MILVVEATGSRRSGFLPARYSPVSASTSAQAVARTCGGSGRSSWAAARSDPDPRTSTSATSAATILARFAFRRIRCSFTLLGQARIIALLGL
jgi:hypothetical protein